MNKITPLLMSFTLLIGCGGGGGGGGSSEPTPSAPPAVSNSPGTSPGPGLAGNVGTPSTGSNATSSGSNTTTTSVPDQNSNNGQTVTTSDESDSASASGTANLVVDPGFDFSSERTITLVINRPTGVSGAVHLYRSRAIDAPPEVVSFDPSSRISTVLATDDFATLQIGAAWNELILHWVPENGVSQDSIFTLAIDNQELTYTINI